MQWKDAIFPVVLTSIALFLLGAGIYTIGVINSNKSNPPPGVTTQSPTSGGGTNKNDDNDNVKKKIPTIPAKCAELRPVPGLKLQQLQGGWILQEKFDFPDIVSAHTVTLTRDQTSICMKTEMVDVTDKGSTLFTDFYMKNQLTKNFTGYIKVKENMHWNFHMLAKDHDGMVIDADPNRYFVFIECVILKPTVDDAILPGSVFIFTRGSLPEVEMQKIRNNTENTLRHNDEIFIDFGDYCNNNKVGTIPGLKPNNFPNPPTNNLPTNPPSIPPNNRTNIPPQNPSNNIPNNTTNIPPKNTSTIFPNNTSNNPPQNPSNTPKNATNIPPITPTNNAPKLPPNNVN